MKRYKGGLIDLSFFTEFYYAEKIESYIELINYMDQFNKEFYEKLGIYIEPHYLIPEFECDNLDDQKKIWLPVSLHFRAHILRAREFKENEAYVGNADWVQTKVMGNYTEAFCILKRFKSLQGVFYKEYKEAEEFYQKWYKPSTYEAAFGKRKATIIKRKIAVAMSNLNPFIIQQRNENIAKYAANRPQSHNDAISKAKSKSVINVTINKIYANSKDAAKDLNVTASAVQKCCTGKINKVKDCKFEYII